MQAHAASSSALRRGGGFFSLPDATVGLVLGHCNMLAHAENFTVFTEFLLMDISSSRELQVLQGLIFSVIYLGALAGNLVIFTVIVVDSHLHFPMYFFIECAAQTFLFILFGATDFFFLVVMSYDRYVAICHPLHYGLTMTPRLCTQVAGVSWASGLVYSAVHTGTMFRLPFTESNVIHQFFCDIPQVLSISSQDVQFSESVVLALSACIILFCLFILFTSYVHIFSTVLHMHSVEARNKALSTCSPQVATLILLVISGLFAVLGPVSNESTIQTLLMTMFYSMIPPFINPFIFGLRNREIKNAIGRMFKSIFNCD
ncbi:Olfactory Receptor 14I1 [Manis pentadactyla]|nr:Olfactory Receptor 14I1 [Manis pentadactyla]